ncbi:MutS-related protein [Metaclostridioides mangenotii]|uniref:MutS-related protein n=1 Tax=Metaclostridioides mangenotii TaxID=1540 RepID=UPI0026EC5E83|nr:DNA mismatch repair protein MutS [Clostridioides mangenotii]
MITITMIEFINESEILKFILAFVCMCFIILIISFYQNIKHQKMIRGQIVEQFGKSIDVEESMINMNSVSSFYRNSSCGLGEVDDITWNDLNMNDIYKKINNTQSTAGSEMLYVILRETISDLKTLTKRDEIIEFFRNNAEERFKVQYLLAKLGINKDLYSTNCLYNEMDNEKSNIWLYRFLTILPFVFVGLMVVWKWFLYGAILSLVFNVTFAMRKRVKKINVDGYKYMIKLINITNSIKRLDLEILNENMYQIDDDLKKLESIKSINIDSNTNNIMAEFNILTEYTNLLFLRELRKYEIVKDKIMKNQDNLIRIYRCIGEIDALIAVASFRNSLNYYTKPKLFKSNSQDENKMEFEGIYHPLISSPVVNSGNFSRGILITGSNASGKSTFIKTVAINAILAQTIYTTCSTKYTSSLFDIYTSMALKDDILSSESYFMVEIKSLKRIVENANNQKPILCFVDEILRGTNTIERIASSCEVLKYLGSGNTICFAATHDVELTQLLEDQYENYHFEENITDKDIKFDYKLHKGRAQSRNAIKLLEFMGYSLNIVKNATNRANRFIESGKWDN